MKPEALISPHNDMALWTAMFVLVAFAFWAERTRLGKSVSGIMLAIAVSMTLSNLNILPKSAPAYDVVWTYLIPLSIPLLLFKADLRRIIPETKGMLLAFLFGALGTTVGAVIGVHVLPLGESAPSLAGIFSATYIGGSMNMAAVGAALGVHKDLLTASVAADNFVGVLYLALLAMMPMFTFLRRWIPSDIIERAEKSADAEAEHSVEHSALNPFHIALALSLSFAICTASNALSAYLGIGTYNILFVTAFSVLIANAIPQHMKKLEGDYETGLIFMYLFFIIVGAGADIAAMFENALIIAAFCAIILFFHMVTIFGAGWFFKLDLAEIIIASNACSSGPASAVALAAGKSWKELITPAVMLGVFGYVIANFIGISLAGLLS
ncbi:DUF819 domain-containing protein [Kordiimonas marina]|uniref:DUF819 family protein n=1 Tax=Kordiimonas marina TaxID=2872312 RepID=UPI001FF3BFB3|nr:DUF819 family protein [Kordiimonas marina]MCJ9427984.1 DUF819 family protein [Kordiimonas marina]